MKISLHKIVRVWGPALFWMAVIALESTDLASSAHTSRVLTWIVQTLTGKIDYLLLDTLNRVLRKIGHFVGYAVLSLLLFRAWRDTFVARVRRLASRANAPDTVFVKYVLPAWQTRWALLALLGTSTVAALDEWHQTFIPSRTGTVTDWLLDTGAGFFMQMLLLVLLLTKTRTTTPIRVSSFDGSPVALPPLSDAQPLEERTRAEG